MSIRIVPAIVAAAMFVAFGFPPANAQQPQKPQPPQSPLAMTTTALVCLAVGLSASNSVAQQKSLKEQLVGTWTLVSSDQVRPDGSKLKQFGANPKGINVFNANGRFFLMVASADNSRIAARDPNETIRRKSAA
jgi:hypothetical protein